MRRSQLAILIAFLALLLTPALGCGSDDTSDSENADEGWNLGNNGDTPNNGTSPNNQPTPNQNNGNTNNDSPNDQPNNGVPTNNTEPNNGVPTNNTEPNNGDFSVDDLVGQTLYAVWRVVDTPAIAGLYFSLEFVDDSTVIFNTDQTLEGQWDILDEGDLHISGLNAQPDQYLLTPELDDGLALELQVPADTISPYRLRFEIPSSDDLAIESFEGRWQSTETITGEDGVDRYLAIRVDDQGYIEYGGLSDTGTFFGILQGPGHIHTFNDSGRPFWVVMTESGPNPVPFAGEIEDFPGGFTLYSFAEDFSDPVAPEVVSVEFEGVDQFSID